MFFNFICYVQKNESQINYLTPVKVQNLLYFKVKNGKNINSRTAVQTLYGTIFRLAATFFPLTCTYNTDRLNYFSNIVKMKSGQLAYVILTVNSQFGLWLVMIHDCYTVLKT